MAQTLDLLTSSRWTISIPVEIPLVRRTKYEILGPPILAQAVAGVSIADIAKQHAISEDLAGRILEFAKTGVKPDWHEHARRPRTVVAAAAERPKYVRFAKFVMELHDLRNVPLSRIPAVIKERFNEKISESTVTAAYKYAQTVERDGGDFPDIPA